MKNVENWIFQNFFKLKKLAFSVNSHITLLYIAYTSLLFGVKMYSDSEMHILQSKFENIDNLIFQIFLFIKICCDGRFALIGTCIYFFNYWAEGYLHRVPMLLCSELTPAITPYARCTLIYNLIKYTDI